MNWSRGTTGVLTTLRWPWTSVRCHRSDSRELSTRRTSLKTNNLPDDKTHTGDISPAANIWSQTNVQSVSRTFALVVLRDWEYHSTCSSSSAVIGRLNLEGTHRPSCEDILSKLHWRRTLHACCVCQPNCRWYEFSRCLCLSLSHTHTHTHTLPVACVPLAQLARVDYSSLTAIMILHKQHLSAHLSPPPPWLSSLSIHLLSISASPPPGGGLRYLQRLKKRISQKSPLISAQIPANVTCDNWRSTLFVIWRDERGEDEGRGDTWEPEEDLGEPPWSEEEKTDVFVLWNHEKLHI